jgi:hypothetical protein
MRRSDALDRVPEAADGAVSIAMMLDDGHITRAIKRTIAMRAAVPTKAAWKSRPQRPTTARCTSRHSNLGPPSLPASRLMPNGQRGDSASLAENFRPLVVDETGTLRPTVQNAARVPTDEPQRPCAASATLPGTDAIREL